MSQSDLTVETDVGGSTFGLDVENALKAIVSNSKGPSAPSTKYDGQFWLDDSATPWALMIWDGADWVKFGDVDAANDAFDMPGSGLVLREKQIVSSAQAAVTFENIVDDDVLIVARGVTASSTSAKAACQIGNGGSPTTAGYVSRVASDWGSASGGSSSMWSTDTTIGSTAVGLGWRIRISNLQSNDSTAASNKNVLMDVRGNLSGSVTADHLGGYMTSLQSTVADTVVIMWSTGNITAGTFMLFGYGE